MRFGPILKREFYDRPTVEVARDLLGKVLVHGPAAGVIVETEAYLGGEDLAAHSARGITERTRVIFGPPGPRLRLLHLRDVRVPEPGLRTGGSPRLRPDSRAGAGGRHRTHAAAAPAARKPEDLASGPGKLTLAMAITRAQNGADVTRGSLVVREPAETRHVEIAVTPRIGITKCADLPLRFSFAGNRFVSGRKA